MCRRFFGLWCLVVLIFVILNHVFSGEVKVFRVFFYCRAVAFFGKLVFVESVVVVGLVIAVVVFGQVFVLVFNWMMYRSIVEHIDEVQAEHAATDWYRETAEFFKVLRTEPADAASARTLRALQEEFRLSNKFAAPEAEGVEAEISSELGELQKELQAGAAISERAERIKRLFARRNILLAARLNQSK